MKEIRIHQGMVGTKELESAQMHNARCEIVADINKAMEDDLAMGGHAPLLRALTRLKGAAMKEDFGDYEGDLFHTVIAYSEQVDFIIQTFGDNV